MKSFVRAMTVLTSGLATVCLAACGSSGSSGGATGSAPAGSSSTAKVASGEAITIGVPESDNGNGFADYYVGDGLTAWSKDLNSHGGIGGRPVKLIRCNDQGTTAGATQCTRNQVQNAKILLGTGFSPYASAITGPGFMKAGIPWVSVAGNSAGDVDGSGSTVCVVPTALASYQALPSYAVKTLKLSKIAQIRLDVPQLDLVNQEIKASTSAAGGELVANVTAPLSAADFSGPVQQAVAKGAQAIVVVETVPAVIKIIQTAASLGFKGTIMLGSGTMTPDVQKVVTPAAAQGLKVVTTADFPDPAGTTPEVVAYRAAMTKYGFAKDLDNGQAESGWATGQYLQKVLEGLGPKNITRASLKTALTSKTYTNVPMYDGAVGHANATPKFPALGYIKTRVVLVDGKGQHFTDDIIDVAEQTAALK